MRRLLRSLSAESVGTHSDRIASHVLNSEAYKKAESISLFLSMPAEVQTERILEHAFSDNKAVYIPKIDKLSDSMDMVQVNSIDDIKTFPVNPWGIAEPSDEQAKELRRANENMETMIDLVIVPGLAFDRTGNRLGHGKGYYGSHCKKQYCTVLIV